MSTATSQHILSLRDEIKYLRVRVTELENNSRDLVSQIQANVQGFSHAPMVQAQPIDPTVPVGYEYDETGLIASPIYHDDQHDHLPELDI